MQKTKTCGTIRFAFVNQESFPDNYVMIITINTRNKIAVPGSFIFVCPTFPSYPIWKSNSKNWSKTGSANHQFGSRPAPLVWVLQTGNKFSRAVHLLSPGVRRYRRVNPQKRVQAASKEENISYSSWGSQKKVRAKFWSATRKNDSQTIDLRLNARKTPVAYNNQVIREFPRLNKRFALEVHTRRMMT